MSSIYYQDPSLSSACTLKDGISLIKGLGDLARFDLLASGTIDTDWFESHLISNELKQKAASCCLKALADLKEGNFLKKQLNEKKINNLLRNLLDKTSALDEKIIGKGIQSLRRIMENNAVPRLIKLTLNY